MSPTSFGTKLSQPQTCRLQRLLPMEYTPTEIAGELKINVRRIWERFVPAGCPHRKDEGGHIFIVGTAFREWYERTSKARVHPMEADEAWCLRCRRPVLMEGPFEVIPTDHAEILQGRCSRCGEVVNRARARQEVDDAAP